MPHVQHTMPSSNIAVAWRLSLRGDPVVAALSLIHSYGNPVPRWLPRAPVAAIFAWDEPAEAEDKEAKDQEQSTPGVHHPRGLHLVQVVGGDHAEGREGREPSERDGHVDCGA